MTKEELKKELDKHFDDDEVVVCADEDGGWDNILYLGRVGHTAAIICGGGSPFSDD